MFCREIHLPDGRRLLRSDRYDKIRQSKGYTEEQMASTHLFRVSPSFRVVAVGNLPNRENPWLNAEVLGIFLHIETLDIASLDDKIKIISSISPPTSSIEVDILTVLKHACASLEDLSHRGSLDTDNAVLSPSCRQLLRLWKLSTAMASRLLPNYALDHMKFKENVISYVNDRLIAMFMVPFMPSSMKESVQRCLVDHSVEMEGISELFSAAKMKDSLPNKIPKNESIPTKSVQFGSIVMSKASPAQPELVPDTRFVSIDKHLSYLESIASDVVSHEKNILLIGNQGDCHALLVLCSADIIR